jgi:hypothetical protein
MGPDSLVSAPREHEEPSALTGTSTPQPATPTVPFGARPGRKLGTRVARRGAALVRMVLLVGFTGFLVAMVVATVFAALVIAINGRLP